MAKRGRPKIENPRSMNYRLRLTQEEYDELEDLAERNGTTMSEILRNGIRLQRSDAVSGQNLKRIESSELTHKPFIVFPTEQIFTDKHECALVMSVPVGVITKCLNKKLRRYKRLTFYYLDEIKGLYDD